jgi:lipoic acid synthetase
LGETREEVLTAMADLRSVDCDILTLGQYLQPTRQHLPVQEFIAPEQFLDYARLARQMGFVHAACGPLVRSSYHAEDFSQKQPQQAAESAGRDAGIAAH